LRLFSRAVGNTGAIRLTSALWALVALAATFGLGRRLRGMRTGILSATLLGTMMGFVHTSHWIRLDIALMACTVAAAWCFAEAYVGGKIARLVPAGIFTGAAFLVKGPIGPAFVALGWIGLAVPWMRDRLRTGANPHFAAHAAALLAFLLPACAWMTALRLTGGRELWNEWFWMNQVGRATGSATHLEHIRPGEYLFYLKPIITYPLPWTLGLVAWVAALGSGLRRRSTRPETLFLAVWIIGSLVMLSIPATKRNVYMVPLLPPLALACAGVFEADFPRWCRIPYAVWMWACIGLLTLAAISPIVVPLLPGKTAYAGTLASFGAGNALCGVACVLATVLALRGGTRKVDRTVAVTAITLVGLAPMVTPAINAGEDIAGDFKAFVARIPPERRPRTTAWNPIETTRALFYYYADWSIAETWDTGDLKSVLAGTDPRFDSAVVGTSELSDEWVPPHRVIERLEPRSGRNRRRLSWIEGVPTGSGIPDKSMELTQP
jgi:4-amino-4-deoxy-L-arabinose transferase-like glycosyltransferase